MSGAGTDSVRAKFFKLGNGKKGLMDKLVLGAKICPCGDLYE